MENSKEPTTVWSQRLWISQLVVYFVYTVPYIFIMCETVFVWHYYWYVTRCIINPGTHPRVLGCQSAAHPVKSKLKKKNRIL
jgi:hypothetical protein